MPNGWWYMPPEPVPADPGRDDDPAWSRPDPMTQQEREAWLARDLARAAAHNPKTTWCVTITDDKGHAVGGQLLEGPAPAPNGDRLIARHPDGAVFEYIETGEPQA